MINANLPTCRSVQRAAASFTLSVTLSILVMSGGVFAQQSSGTQTGRDGVLPMGQWLEFRRARYGTQPILLHLRTGYERAVLMPEPVVLEEQGRTLPGCDIVIENNVIGFYPTRNFRREPVWFVGLETGKRYELRVRASTKGIRQPLEITR